MLLARPAIIAVSCSIDIGVVVLVTSDKRHTVINTCFALSTTCLACRVHLLSSPDNTFDQNRQLKRQTCEIPGADSRYRSSPFEASDINSVAYTREPCTSHVGPLLPLAVRWHIFLRLRCVSVDRRCRAITYHLRMKHTKHTPRRRFPVSNVVLICRSSVIVFICSNLSLAVLRIALHIPSHKDLFSPEADERQRAPARPHARTLPLTAAKWWTIFHSKCARFVWYTQIFVNFIPYKFIMTTADDDNDDSRRWLLWERESIVVCHQQTIFSKYAAAFIMPCDESFVISRLNRCLSFRFCYWKSKCEPAGRANKLSGHRKAFSVSSNEIDFYWCWRSNELTWKTELNILCDKRSNEREQVVYCVWSEWRNASVNSLHCIFSGA